MAKYTGEDRSAKGGLHMWLLDIVVELFFFWLWTDSGSSNPDQSAKGWLRLLIILLMVLGLVWVLWLVFHRR